ncbi:MAG: amidohydrolase family protein, partial [Caulobacterales bacterium]|uniref:amidohydrolase family protein n=1 Tax=Glycocaulis sp. TaxID=1969725 RepID=UPI003F9EDBDF
MAARKEWDLLIRSGLVIDGSGKPPATEDIAIRDGRIVQRGAGLDPSAAREVIEAEGRWVMPGLLDIHTHFDLEVELDPGLPEAVRHGTTTVLMSNCSLGICFGNQRRNGEDPIVDCFARVENMPKHVLRKAADLANWTSTAEYLDHLDTLDLGINVVPMIPHSMLRAEVMGLKESVSREPTEAELQAMEGLLETAMAEGYVGFSTDALPFHFLAEDPHRKTKIPSQFGSYGELKRLTGVLRRWGRMWQATPPKDNPVEVFRNFALTSGRVHGKPLKVTAVAAMDVAANRNLVKLAKILTRLLNSTLFNGHFRFQALAA